MGKLFQGSIILGDGFLLDEKTAASMTNAHPELSKVIFPIINGSEVNSAPDQLPGRLVINFFDWPISEAAKYVEAYERVETLAKPSRIENDAAAKWWQYWRPRPELYSAILGRSRCFVAAATTKYLNFSALPTTYVFTHALFVFTTDRWDLYAIVQSGLHEVWARKYSGALETRLRYSPSDCFETFPFPDEVWKSPSPKLAEIGERYHKHRRDLMLQLWLGLTDIYNLFHNRNLAPSLVAKISNKSAVEADGGYAGILELRRLRRELDNTVRDAYGWHDDLRHDLYEVETLPENDRIRYTIAPAARKDILKRLLLLNHERAAAESNVAHAEKRSKKATKSEVVGTDLF